jgi:hypothetical protein
MSDLDPAARVLDTLAADFADPGDETAACASMWPLLAVPDDLLSPLDRQARDRHLARCARCRIALTETWLDADGAALQPITLPVPRAMALPTLPERRRRTTRVLAGVAIAAAAAASLFTIVVPMVQSSIGTSPSSSEEPRLDGPRVRVNPLTPPPTFDLLVLVESGVRFEQTMGAIDDTIAALPAHLPKDSRVTVALALGGNLKLVGRDLSPDELGTARFPPFPMGADQATDYDQVLPAVRALLPETGHRRALLVIGHGCDTRTVDPSGRSVAEMQELEASGVQVASVNIGMNLCRAVVVPHTGSGSVSGLAAYTGHEVERLVARASAQPAPARVPMDVVVLVDGHGALLGDATETAPSAFPDVARALDAIDSHLPPRSSLQIGTMTGDTVVIRSQKRDPKVPVGGEALGASRSYTGNLAPPRHAAVIERGRHLFLGRADADRVLLLIGTGCELTPDERDARSRQLAAATADGITIAAIEYRPEVLASCARAWDEAPAGLVLHRAAMSSSLPGLVADTLDDLDRLAQPTAAQPPETLLHFIHHTLSAP